MLFCGCALWNFRSTDSSDKKHQLTILAAHRVATINRQRLTILLAQIRFPANPDACLRREHWTQTRGRPLFSIHHRDGQRIEQIIETRLSWARKAKRGRVAQLRRHQSVGIVDVGEAQVINPIHPAVLVTEAQHVEELLHRVSHRVQTGSGNRNGTAA